MAYFIRKFPISTSEPPDYRDPDNTVIYRDLKNLAFAPEFDMTLATMPICEFTVDVVTTQPPTTFVGAFVDLCEDRDTTKQQKIVLAGYYRVTEATRMTPEVVSIRAQSMLAWLETRRMPYYDPTETQWTVAQMIEKLFSGGANNKDSDIYDNFGYLPYVLADTMNWTVVGACPEQTARERLAWLSQAYGLLVRQWGDDSKSGLLISQISERYNRATITPSIRIQYEQTFNRPTITDVEPAMSFDVTQYYNFTSTEQTGDDVEKMELAPEYHYPDAGMIDPGTTVYYRYLTTRTTNTGVNVGDAVQIDHNTLITDRSASNMLSYLPHVLFDCDCEIDADILQTKKSLADEYAWPGDVVYIYINSDTVYVGTIISCDFIFGAQARSHIVVRAVRQPVQIFTATLRYTYRSRVLAIRQYRSPDWGLPLVVRNPVIKYYYGDVVDTFNPSQSTTAISWHSDSERTVEYTRADERDP